MSDVVEKKQILITGATFRLIGYDSRRVGVERFLGAGLPAREFLESPLDPFLDENCAEGPGGIKTRLLIWSGFFDSAAFDRLALRTLELADEYSADWFAQYLEPIQEVVRFRVGRREGKESGVPRTPQLYEYDGFAGLTDDDLRVYRAFRAFAGRFQDKELDLAVKTTAELAVDPREIWERLYAFVRKELL